MRRVNTKLKNIRWEFNSTEIERMALKYILDNKNTPLQLKYNTFFRLNILKGSRSKVRNICLQTCRTKSVFRFFRLSRIMIRELGLAGKLTGLRKKN